MDDKSDGVDVSVAEPSTFVAKSPQQNGVDASGGTHGAAGLGEGSPKVGVVFSLNAVLILGHLCLNLIFFSSKLSISLVGYAQSWHFYFGVKQGLTNFFFSVYLYAE